MSRDQDVKALIWDARFPLIRLEGQGCSSFLHGQTSAKVDGCAQGVLVQACWLNATGRVQALLEIRLDSAGADVLVLNGDSNSVAGGFDRVIFPADQVRLGEQRQQRRLQRLEAGKAPDWNQVVWLSDSSEPQNSWADLSPCNASELESWRNKQGWPLGDQELTGDTNPFELGLSDWVELNKGCYLGQETVAKLASRGGVKQQLRCWQSTSETQNILQSGDQLKLNDSRAGIITSVCNDPVTRSSFGLALVRRQALDAEILQAGNSDVEVSIARPSAFCDPPARG
ncbi:folate-binding protein YgfZ [Synechococcus sp. UW179A]|uniref:CAF17-like 4Fe-4S cluster assembly/insertion protein YgfZ n=1 Tax=Synechococcus sp. UW179A TaxID=2575510 RepID=UPI000E0F5597|nr:folate-binding protein YgfZ [Synechococcus sp. UW179A]